MRPLLAFVILLAIVLVMGATEGKESVQEYSASEGHKMPGRLQYWDLLMQNPAGKELPKPCPDCAEFYFDMCGDAAEGRECCSGMCSPIYLDTIDFGTFQTSTQCCPEGKLPNLAGCTSDDECCGPDTICSSGTCKSGLCFSGATKVQTLELPGPIPLQEVKTGQHIQCADSADTSLLPGNLHWCEVFNWVDSNPGSFHQHQITFQRPDGSSGSLTVSPNHMMLINAQQSPQAGRIATGTPFRTLGAREVRVGDKLPLPSGSGSTQVLSMATVTNIKAVKARGAYVPAIAKPYMVAEGLLVPLLTTEYIPVVRHGEVHLQTAQLKLMHGGIAPLLGQYLQPKGTRGADAVWGSERRWPGTQALRELVWENVRAHKAVDYALVQRYMAMQRVASKVGLPLINAEDVLKYYQSVWVEGPAPTPKEAAS